VKSKIIAVFFLLCLLALSMAYGGARSKTQAEPAQQHCAATPQASPTSEKHAYHDHPPTQPLPNTKDPEQFRDNHRAYVAYARASQIREILYQLPCYCECDKEEGHTSLLDCFLGEHGKSCHTCQREAVFAYEENLLHKTVEQIRAGLANDDHHKKIDMNKYVEEAFAELTRSEH
jgi:hypothetical protein